MALGIEKTRFVKSPVHVARYIAYMDRQSPLFNADGELLAQTAIDKYLDTAPSFVWDQVFSIGAEDAQRLGVDRSYMQSLLCAHKAEIAKAYNIRPENIQLIASWHEKDHHPHLHLVYYSTDSREGYLKAHKDTQDQVLNHATERVKSLLVNEIFRGDMAPLKEAKAAQRKSLNEQIKKDIQAIGRDAYKPAPEIQSKLLQLGHTLEQLPGKKVYGYLPPAVKKEVDALLKSIIDRDPTCAQLLEEYAQSQRGLIDYYAKKTDVVEGKMAEWRESIYHPGKNDDATRHNIIIKAALELNQSIDTSDDPEPAQIHIQADTAADAAAEAGEASQERPRKKNHYRLVHLKDMMLDESYTNEDRLCAAKDLQAAADQGDSYAQYHIGKAYCNGIVFAPDKDKASYYWQAAMNEGNMWAAYALGKLHQDTAWQGYDPIKAAALFETAWNQETLSAAAYQLGKVYLKGNGREQDCAQAITWFESAASGNMASWSNYSLGKIYQTMGDGTLATNYFKRSAVLGNSFGKYHLAKAYLSGHGVSPAPRKAAELFMALQASEDPFAVKGQINAWSTYYLGKMYLRGIGVPRDRAQGLSLLQEAASRGIEPAQDALQRDATYQAKSTLCATRSLIQAVANSLRSDGNQAKSYGASTITRYERLRRAAKHRTDRVEESH